MVRFMNESIERFKKVEADFNARVEATPDSAWSNPSPCAQWKARDVVAHVANNYRRIAGGTLPEIGEGEDIRKAWSASREGLHSMLASADLSANVDGPFGPMPLDQLMGRIIATDTLVHTWDLARAVGGDEKLDAEAVSGAYSGLKPMDAMLRNPGFFDAKVDPPAGADEQTEFLCFLGRKV